MQYIAVASGTGAACFAASARGAAGRPCLTCDDAMMTRTRAGGEDHEISIRWRPRAIARGPRQATAHGLSHAAVLSVCRLHCRLLFAFFWRSTTFFSDGGAFVPSYVLNRQNYTTIFSNLFKSNLKVWCPTYITQFLQYLFVHPKEGKNRI